MCMSFEKARRILRRAAPALLLLAGCAKKEGEDVVTLADHPLPVVVSAATNAPFSRTITVQGSLESVESATVSARIPGPLLTVDADLGDAVKAGKTRLFQVDPVAVENQAAIAREAVATAKARVAVAEAQVAKAKAAQKKHDADAARFARLKAEDRVSDNEAEQVELLRETGAADVAVAEASLVLARQQVSQAEANLRIAERQLSDATVFAPIDGVVQSRLAEPGEMAAAGRPVFVLNGTNELKALAYLPAQHYDEIVPGSTKVALSVNGVSVGTFPIAAKSPAVNPKLRTFEIKALLPGSEKAFPGAMAGFDVVLESRTGISVPAEAVLRRAAGEVVFVAEGGRAVEKTVRTGLRTAGRIEILGGLDAGAPVIVQGQSQCYEGRLVQVERN